MKINGHIKRCYYGGNLVAERGSIYHMRLTDNAEVTRKNTFYSSRFTSSYIV